MKSVLAYKTIFQLILLILINSFSFAFGSSLKNTDLIYGKDDRKEVNDYSDQDFIEKSRSVAIKIKSNLLTENQDDSNILNFPQRLLKKAIPKLCSTEKYLNQISIGTCSGFLIAPDKLVTAGHCMISNSECANNKWAFDFKDGTTQFNKNNVYSCKRILIQKTNYNEKEVSDYAVIELDRKVTDRTPLQYRKMGRILLNTPLVVIGHPLGIPMKIVDGAKVQRMNSNEFITPIHSWLLKENYFTANLDVYAGNSGSPVFNKRTGKVEGVLIQGAEDFKYNYETQCLESNHYTNSHLTSSEKVMRITKIDGL